MATDYCVYRWQVTLEFPERLARFLKRLVFVSDVSFMVLFFFTFCQRRGPSRYSYGSADAQMCMFLHVMENCGSQRMQSAC